jgi:hypothetical protein
MDTVFPLWIAGLATTLLRTPSCGAKTREGREPVVDEPVKLNRAMEELVRPAAGDRTYAAAAA